MQTKFTINGWEDYWNLFDLLTESLVKSEQYECVVELKKSKKLVNGLTDGWFQFLFHFSDTVNTYKDRMSESEIEIAKFLISSLKKTLYRKDSPDKY
jgi:hypothetical protein